MAEMFSYSLNNDADKLTSKIFTILENNFLFGYTDTTHNHLSSSSGKIRILSIDAGDGVLAAKSLLHLESFLRRKSGNPTAHIADFFDVVTGAGLGGILAGLLFTRSKDDDDSRPMFTADQAYNFMVNNCRKFTHPSTAGLFRRTSKSEKLLNKVFGDLTLKDTMKAVLIPCYDLRTSGVYLFSRADAMEMGGCCDFRLAEVCKATVAQRVVEVKSTDRMRKILAVGGGLGMSNPAAAAITHVLNNKQEFPTCNGVDDLLVLSLGDFISPRSSFLRIAADGAADMVDQAVSMAFGERRRTNYVRIQGNVVDDMLGQKNVESMLFGGKKVSGLTNIEKLELMGREVVQEQERRVKSILPVVLLKNINSPSPRRSSSATTMSASTLSSSSSSSSSSS